MPDSLEPQLEFCRKGLSLKWNDDTNLGGVFLAPEADVLGQFNGSFRLELVVRQQTLLSQILPARRFQIAGIDNKNIPLCPRLINDTHLVVEEDGCHEAGEFWCCGEMRRKPDGPPRILRSPVGKLVELVGAGNNAKGVFLQPCLSKVAF